jgi:indole-3-glycerol phosphate synthase
MTDILQKIIADKQREILELKQNKDFDTYLQQAQNSPHPRSFGKALLQGPRINLIAEVKKASPSKGLLRSDFKPVEIAQGYQRGGARAISVLTEDNYFQGHREYLSQIRETVRLPLLRKDFIVDPFQVPESRLLGADAILLIAGALTDSQLRDLILLAQQLHLETLCEVHDKTEMKRVVDAGAILIGINNRDLKTFEVSLQTTFDLVPLAPDNAILVSESGIRCAADLQILQDVGVNAVLVGETLIRQADVTQAIRNLYDPQVPAPSDE